MAATRLLADLDPDRLVPDLGVEQQLELLDVIGRCATRVAPGYSDESTREVALEAMERMIEPYIESTLESPAAEEALGRPLSVDDARQVVLLVGSSRVFAPTSLRSVLDAEPWSHLVEWRSDAVEALGLQLPARSSEIAFARSAR